MTVGEYCEHFLRTTKATIRPSTWERYAQLLRVHVIPTIGGVKLRRLSAAHLEDLYATRLAGGLSPTTVYHLHSVVRRALGRAERSYIVDRNVAALVDAPRRARHGVTAFDAGQVGRLLNAASGDPLEALYLLAISTGMRQGELLALKSANVSFEAGRLQVRSTVRRTKDGWHFGEPKSARSRRQITLTPDAVEALRVHKARQAGERLRRGRAWNDNDLVFSNEVGNPVEVQNLVRRSYFPLLARAGLPVIISTHSGIPAPRCSSSRGKCRRRSASYSGIPRWL